MKYPIAETFYSIQGEGVWTGTPMFFVRLAGCNVGKYSEAQKGDTVSLVGTAHVNNEPALRLYAKGQNAVCTAHDGTQFLCDTDYHRTEWLDSIMLTPWLKKGDQKVKPDHVCITGGEPFLYVLDELLGELDATQVLTHIETSGTKPIKLGRQMTPAWITCCPKEGFLAENYDKPNEWKFLAGPAFDPKSVDDFLSSSETRPVFLQPINGVNEPDHDATMRVVEIVKQHPQWRLSAQLHKYLSVR